MGSNWGRCGPLASTCTHKHTHTPQTPPTTTTTWRHFYFVSLMVSNLCSNSCFCPIHKASHTITLYYYTAAVYIKGMPRDTWLSESSIVTWHPVISSRLSQPNLTKAGTEGPHSEKRNKGKCPHICLWLKTEHGIWTKMKSNSLGERRH